MHVQYTACMLHLPVIHVYVNTVNINKHSALRRQCSDTIWVCTNSWVVFFTGNIHVECVGIQEGIYAMFNQQHVYGVVIYDYIGSFHLILYEL